MTKETKQFYAMLAYAMPLVEKGTDWQEVQWEVLAKFDFLTNSEDDEERIMEVIRECEARLQEPLI